jgi:hypothetical protein
MCLEYIEHAPPVLSRPGRLSFLVSREMDIPHGADDSLGHADTTVHACQRPYHDEAASSLAGFACPQRQQG